MGCFQLYRDEQGNHCFRLHTDGGSIVLCSAPYPNATDARNDLAAVCLRSGDTESYVRDKSVMGWSFSMKADDRVIGTGPLYATMHDRENAIAHIMRTAPDADVFDLGAEEAAEEQGQACGW